MSIESHLKKYFDVPNKHDVAELVLDGVQVAEIKESEKKALEQYSASLVLSMNNCGLKNLSNLPKFAELEILELTDNKISGSELGKIQYKNLAKLRLSNNPISSLEDIKSLSKLENLELLDLLDCPVSKVANYREEVYKLLPKLQVLDMMYKDGAIYESEGDFDGEEDGEFDDEEGEDFIEEGEDFEDDEDFSDEEEEESAKPAKKPRH